MCVVSARTNEQHIVAVRRVRINEANVAKKTIYLFFPRGFGYYANFFHEICCVTSPRLPDAPILVALPVAVASLLRHTTLADAPNSWMNITGAKSLPLGDGMAIKKAATS